MTMSSRGMGGAWRGPPRPRFGPAFPVGLAVVREPWSLAHPWRPDGPERPTGPEGFRFTRVSQSQARVFCAKTLLDLLSEMSSSHDNILDSPVPQLLQNEKNKWPPPHFCQWLGAVGHYRSQPGS
jgi:hypothetical protein